MIKNILTLFCIILVMIPLSLIAENEKELEARYIDVEMAKKRIEKLQKENEGYTLKVKELETMNTRLREEIDGHNKTLEQINFLIENLKKNGNMLYEQSLTVVDSAGREKATNAYEKNKTIIARVIVKKMEIENYITNKNKLIATNNYEISSYMNRIKINNEEISELQTSIEKTLLKINEINNQFDATSELEKEAERLLQSGENK